MWVRSLGQEDHLEEVMATRSGILAWRDSINRGAWRTMAHRVMKSQTQLKLLVYIYVHVHAYMFLFCFPFVFFP